MHDLLPIQNRDRNRYPLRNSNNYVIPNFRLTSTRLSFIPASIRNWNNLPETTRNSSTVSRFKKAVTPNLQKPPEFFSFGPRRLNILHTKLRYNCSALNYDLYCVNLSETSNCACGYFCENSYHYFMECPTYHTLRVDMLSKLRSYYPVNIDMLLSGKPELSNAENEDIFLIVQTFIRKSNRF